MFNWLGCGGARGEGACEPHDKRYLRSHYQKVPVDPQYAAANPDAKGLCVLGGGKHGKVKLARRLSDGADVAIKSQHTGGIHVWGARRARSEEAIHLALDLPHVVRILDVADSGTKRYIVQELGERIDPASILRVQDAVQLMREVVAGVQELHNVGTYHRDLKLPNVLRVNGMVKITDFGKAVAQPSAVLEATYAWADADGACLMFYNMLANLDADLAARFNAWWKGKPNLRVQDLDAEWLQGDWLPADPPAPALLPVSNVPNVPPAPPPTPPAKLVVQVPRQVSAWSSATYPLRHGWEKSLAYWPLVTKPGTPKRWDPAGMGTDPQGGLRVETPLARQPARRDPSVVRMAVGA